MTELIDLSQHRRSAKGQKRVFFDKTEFRRLLDVYSRHVASGEWRDYAIDALGPMAIFSIFKSSYDKPVFAIAKRRNGKHNEFAVLSGPRTIKRSRSLNEALKVFDKPLKLVE